MKRSELKVQMFFKILEGFSFLGNRDIFWINWPRETGAFFIRVGVSVKIICSGVVDGS